MSAKKFLIESHSSYYLHPSKGPGGLIMAVIFDEKSYDLWEIAVRLLSKPKVSWDLLMDLLKGLNQKMKKIPLSYKPGR